MKQISFDIIKNYEKIKLYIDLREILHEWEMRYFVRTLENLGKVFLSQEQVFDLDLDVREIWTKTIDKK